jgi:ABC-type branched-subunit amino acid transport system substrate-binding protein
VTPSSVTVGVLYDFEQGDGGTYFEAGLRLGFDESGVERRVGAPLRVVARHADGLPGGSEASVVENFDALASEDVVAIVGPSISDNGIIVRELAATAQIPCVNYTGGAITRGEWMFHYQVGSLEEEPTILADHLRQRGATRIAVLYDDTPVGTNYALWFDRALARTGRPSIEHRAAVSALSEDLRVEVGLALSTEPDALVYLGLGMASRAVALAVDASGWKGSVVANSALMFGYARRDWRAGFEGWAYVDTVSDANPVRTQLAERSPAHAASPIGVAAYDIGRLLGEAIALADDRTTGAVRDGLERVKRLPAASGRAGTTMGFGQWDHAALKGDALVLRSWRSGRTEELG